MPVSTVPISVFLSVLDNDPLAATLEWPGDLNEWRVIERKEAAPLWSPVLYRDGGTRTKGETARNILSAHAVVLDYDGGGVTLDAATAAWSGFEHAVYTTHSHLLVKPPKYNGEARFRLVLPLSRPVTVAEYDRVWHWAQAFAQARGVPFDPLADVGRLYYVPAHRPGTEYDYRYNPSLDVLDPDVILALSGDVVVESAPVSRTSSFPIPLSAPAPVGGVPGTGLFSGITNAHQKEDLGRIEAQCAFMAHARADAATLPEPEWYAWLSVIARCRDGDRLAHEIGSAHPSYSKAETSEKLSRALAESGPRTCAAMRVLSPACRGCALTVTSPVMLGRPDPVTATVEEVREDRAARVASSVERTRATFEAQTRIVANLTVDEARARALATHARQFGTPELAADEAGKHAVLKGRLRDEKETLKEAERAFNAAEADAKRATRLAQADPRILSDPLFALDVKTGLPRSSLANVALILERDATYGGVFAHNLFDEKVYYNGKLAADHHDSQINIDIERRYGFGMKTSLVQEAIMKIAHENAFHPVRDYLNALEWDGEDRIASLFATGFGAVGDAQYLSEASRKFAIGAVARILKPGCQMDNMIVLTGKQGAGKSTGLRVLAGTDWFADSALSLGDKDSYMQLAGRWFYEIAELDSFKKADNTRIKAFITSRDDTYRPPYGRHVVKRARQTVLVGSTNEREFLNDPTGSRRFVPIAIGSVDLAWLAASRDQLWAEAVVRFHRGEIWHYDGESAERLAVESAPYQQDDPWEPLVHDFLVRRKQPTVTVLDALTGAVGVSVSQISKGEKSRMIAVLRALGCEEYRATTTAADGVYRQRAFRVPAEILDNVIALSPGGRAPAFSGGIA